MTGEWLNKFYKESVSNWTLSIEKVMVCNNYWKNQVKDHAEVTYRTYNVNFAPYSKI